LKVRSETGQGSGSGMEELLSAQDARLVKTLRVAGAMTLAKSSLPGGPQPGAAGSPREATVPEGSRRDCLLNVTRTVFSIIVRLYLVQRATMTSSDADAEPGEATLRPSIYVHMTAGSGDRILVGRVTCFSGGDLRSQSGSAGQAAGESSVGL
jgi:hypothetical protein